MENLSVSPPKHQGWYALTCNILYIHVPYMHMKNLASLVYLLLGIANAGRTLPVYVFPIDGQVPCYSDPSNEFHYY